MKKYVVFYFEGYYSNGGMNDIVASYDTLEEAQKHLSDNKFGSVQIVDRDTWKIII